MIRLKTLLEQASKESIRVAGKTITGKYIANTENAADKWMYFKGDNNRYYTTLKAKQSWRDLKSLLSPANYKLATSRIESWVKVDPTTPTAETPADPNANVPAGFVPAKDNAIYTAADKILSARILKSLGGVPATYPYGTPLEQLAAMYKANPAEFNANPRLAALVKANPAIFNANQAPSAAPTADQAIDASDDDNRPSSLKWQWYHPR